MAALAVALPAPSVLAGTPQPARLAEISKRVFGARAPAAECIAHYESTDGAWVNNWPNEGPWQVSVDAHAWANAYRLVHDWLYAARVAWVISAHGRDWSAWATHALCGV